MFDGTNADNSLIRLRAVTTAIYPLRWIRVRSGLCRLSALAATELLPLWNLTEEPCKHTHRQL